MPKKSSISEMQFYFILCISYKLINKTRFNLFVYGTVGYFWIKLHISIYKLYHRNCIHSCWFFAILESNLVWKKKEFVFIHSYHAHMICIVILQTGLKSFCSRISENLRFHEISLVFLVNSEQFTVVHIEKKNTNSWNNNV